MYEQWTIYFIGPYGKWFGGREKHGFQNKRIYCRGKEKIKFIRKVSIYCMKPAKEYTCIYTVCIGFFVVAFFNLWPNKPTIKKDIYMISRFGLAYGA